MDISAESSTDGQLMAAVRSHDQQALAELYARYRGRVFACAYAITRDRMVAEEVAQDVFHALWQSAANFHSERSVAAWITGIARHRAVDATRTSHFRARHRELELGIVGARARSTVTKKVHSIGSKSRARSGCCRRHRPLWCWPAMRGVAHTRSRRVVCQSGRSRPVCALGCAGCSSNCAQGNAA